MTIYLRAAILILIAGMISLNLCAQSPKYRPQKNSIGLNFGALSYSGRFAVDASLASHSSLYASLVYRRRAWDKLHVRAEAFGGRMRGDNTDVESQAVKPNGQFQTEMAELSARA